MGIPTVQASPVVSPAKLPFSTNTPAFEPSLPSVPDAYAPSQPAIRFGIRWPKKMTLTAIWNHLSQPLPSDLLRPAKYVTFAKPTAGTQPRTPVSRQERNSIF